MSAEVLGVADAVVIALNGNTFTAPYASLAASRKYVPVYNLKELISLQVTVVAHALAETVIARSFKRQVDYQIDIGFQMRVAGLDQATVDGLMALVEEVADFLISTAQVLTLASGKPATPIGLVNEPIYDPKILDEEQVFLSVLTITYRMFR